MQHRQLTKRFIQVSGNTQINQQNTQQNEEISINRIGMPWGMPIRFLETLPVIRDILPELVNGKTKKSHATG
jgi:hypothetical protein